MSQPGGGNEDKGKGLAAYPVPDEESPVSSLGAQDDSATDAEDDATSEAPTATDFISGLEDALPMKRGLSGHYTGKAKSFGNLTDIPVEDPNDLSKKEHPVNKRRRLQISHEIRIGEMKGGGGGSANVTLARPVLPSDDDDDLQGNDDDQKKGGDRKDDQEDIK